MGMGGGGEHAYLCRTLWYSRDGMVIGNILIILCSYIIVVWARKIGRNDVGTVE